MDPFVPVTAMVLGLLVKAFLSIGELLVASVDVKRITEGEQFDERQLERVITFLKDRERIHATLLLASVGTTVTYATGLVWLVGPDHSSYMWWLQVVGLGALFPLVGEILPRGWAKPRSPGLLLRWILPLKALALLLLPLLWLVILAGRLFTRIFQNPNELHAFVTRDELKIMLQDNARAEIKPLERQMLTRVLEFSALKVEEVMVPLIDVKAIGRDATLEKATQMFIAEGLSRLPVYSERIDNIIGVLYAFDVLYAPDLEDRVELLMRRCRCVPESSPLQAVLKDLQKSHQGMAIVVDEYGGAVGIISVEDILEQVVGDIEDEFDKRAQDLRRVGSHEYLASARLKISKLSQALALELPEGDYETVGGLLLAELGRIPKAGETVFHGPLSFTVRKATDRAIKEVLIAVKHPVRRSARP